MLTDRGSLPGISTAVTSVIFPRDSDGDGHVPDSVYAEAR